MVTVVFMQQIDCSSGHSHVSSPCMKEDPRKVVPGVFDTQGLHLFSCKMIGSYGQGHSDDY